MPPLGGRYSQVEFISRVAARAAVFALLFLAVVAAGCDEANTSNAANNSKTSDAPQMQFNVSSDLLGEAKKFNEFGVEVRPPKDWAPLPSEQVALIARQASAGSTTQPSMQSTSIEQPTPLAVFMRADGAHPSALIVSSVPFADEKTDLAAYSKRLRDEFKEVKDGTFEVNGLRINQFLMQPQGKVNFKLLVSGGNPPAGITGRRLQLDYVVPQSAWSSQVRAVESSIGSLRPATQ